MPSSPKKNVKERTHRTPHGTPTLRADTQTGATPRRRCTSIAHQDSLDELSVVQLNGEFSGGTVGTRLLVRHATRHRHQCVCGGQKLHKRFGKLDSVSGNSVFDREVLCGR